jgi:L-fuconolactonase
VPYGGNDWLALTQEPTLEPEIVICDPHHHFWDHRLERIPYQRYLLHELAADVNSGHAVRSTVFIEARAMYRPSGPSELRPVGEVEFVQGLAAASATGLYGPCRAAAAIIGHADLKLGDRVKPVLEASQAASPNRFRGIRHTVTWDRHPEVGNREKEGVLATAEYRAGAQVLARMGLSLDTGVCFPQLPELASFARTVPDLTIILNHLGGVEPCRPLRQPRRRGLADLEERHRRRGRVPQHPSQIGRHRNAAPRLRLASTREADRFRRIGNLDGAADELLHRAVRPRPVHVRKQLPGR